MLLYRVEKNAVLLPSGSLAMPGTAVGRDVLPASDEWLEGAVAEGTLVKVNGPEDLPPADTKPPVEPTKVDEKWSFNPAALAGLSLDDLNVLIEEHRGEEPVEPAPSIEEAIAFLTQNFVPE